MIIRKYQSGDEQKILNLDKLTENHPWNRRDINNWLWKYKGNNPAGPAIIFVCEDKDEIIAHFAIIPIYYSIFGKKLLASHSIGVMVKPEWQNRGLIKYVVDAAFEEAERRSILFTYGYPNELAYKLHTNLMKYEDISLQQLFQVSKESFNFSLLPELSPGHVVKQFTIFDNFVDELWESNYIKYNIAVIRSADFLNWRYAQRPDVNYHFLGVFYGKQLLGYCVLKLYQEGEILRGHFVDIFTAYNDITTFLHLIHSGITFFWDKNCFEVNLWLQGHHEFQQALFEYGFQTVSKRPLICRFNGPNAFIYKDKLTKDNWYFTMGDTLEIY